MFSQLATASWAHRFSRSTPMARPAEIGGFDHGGADPAHRVDDQGAGGRVFSDDAPRQLGRHFAGYAVDSGC